jgi:hypothetical protein
MKIISILIYAIIYLLVAKFIFKKKGLKGVLLFMILLPIMSGAAIYFFKTFPLVTAIFIISYFVIVFMNTKTGHNESSSEPVKQERLTRHEFRFGERVVCDGFISNEDGKYYSKEVIRYVDHDIVILKEQGFKANGQYKEIQTRVEKDIDDLSIS